MVLRGTKSKYKTGSNKETTPQPSSKMASAVSSQPSTSHKIKPLKIKLNTVDINEESDSDSGNSQTEFQSALFKKFECILQKALKQTSDHITDKLTREIREIGLRTAELEIRVDDIESQTQHYISEFKNLKEENVLLQSRLEDQENKDKRANLQIRGILESVTDVQAYITTLLQELQPGIPMERLEMDRVPKSQCSISCLPGYRKVPSSSIHPCCHSCVLCSYGEISNITDSENCMKCPDHEWPNENRTRCIPKEVEFLSFTDDTLSLVFITFSLLCFGKTLLVLVIFILYQDTPVVKANNKSLSFVLLVSIMLGFLCVFLFLGRPVDVTCLLRQIYFGILFTIAVSSVLAKTIMVCIAFKATKPNSVWRKWIGVKLPTCIVLACSSVQVIICVSWLSISPPFQELDTHSHQEKIIIQCNEGSVIGFYSVLGYMGILAAVSFIIAFFVRTLPDSFNEAKYITFSMLVFCSVWIAMIPAYLSTKGKYTVAVEIFAILISNNGLLYCIFLTKCFIILCRPELNTKVYLHSQRNI
ncbi:vomeronasal type-2 receptor 26-like [Aquarana catesbeiana]|uniref:vomeronasal type-2 receptor 26-like n=1 Tax=Aquarana catesbeiana TaxID=8400 RepID=UPI003CC96369